MNKVHLYGWNWIKQFIPKIPDNFILVDYPEHYFFGPKATVINMIWFFILNHTISDYSSINLINLFESISPASFKSI
jgi:hypothetical protein